MTHIPSPLPSPFFVFHPTITRHSTPFRSSISRERKGSDLMCRSKKSFYLHRHYQSSQNLTQCKQCAFVGWWSKIPEAWACSNHPPTYIHTHPRTRYNHSIGYHLLKVLASSSLYIAALALFFLSTSIAKPNKCLKNRHSLSPQHPSIYPDKNINCHSHKNATTLCCLPTRAALFPTPRFRTPIIHPPIG